MAVITLPTSGIPVAGSRVFLIEAAEAIEVSRAIRINSQGKASVATCSDATRDDVDGFSTSKAYAAGQWITYVKPGTHLTVSGLTKGVTYYLAHGTDEVQTATITGSPAGGTFRLTYAGAQTATIAYNANAATITTALEALSTIGTGNVLVTGTGPFVITFKKSLGAKSLGLITTSHTFTGGTSPDIAVVETTDGAPDGKICLFADLVTNDSIVVIGAAVSATDLVIAPNVLNAVV